MDLIEVHWLFTASIFFFFKRKDGIKGSAGKALTI